MIKLKVAMSRAISEFKNILVLEYGALSFHICTFASLKEKKS